MTAFPCREVVPIPIEQPTPSPLPNIPIPEPNMDSIMATLNAMRQMLNLLAGRVQPKKQPYKNPLTRPPSKAPGQGSKNPQQPKNKQGRWLELSRKTAKVKIKNPDDPDQFVVVQRTNQLILKDSVTGEQWIYNRGSSGDEGGNSADGGEDG